MKKILYCLSLLGCLAVSPAMAQSTASQAVTGYLTTSGCTPSTATPCFVQYGASGGPGGTVTQGEPNAGTTHSWWVQIYNSIVGIRGADGSTIASITNPVPVEGNAASGAAVAGNPMGDGCRAATAAPTAVTDGQAIFVECGAEGKAVTLPYTIKELAVRGTASGTDGAAHSIIASAGGSLKNYITSVQCSNTSSTTTTVTFSDSASSVLIVPGQGGNNAVFPVPLATAAATAFSFTAATGVTTMTCNAQGYTGL